jgi:hypothetical protein
MVAQDSNQDGATVLELNTDRVVSCSFTAAFVASSPGEEA